MRISPFIAIALLSTFLLTGCGGDSGHGSDHPDSYNKCLETEAAKLLDETGSNLDYANEKAAEICAK
jgi:hypothetical protein